MTKKENTLRIIRFDHPERIVSGPPGHGMGYLGCNHEGYAGGGHDSPVGIAWTDVWGTVWRKELEGVMGFPQAHPLAEVESLRTYRWPDFDDERICGRIYEQAKAHAAAPDEAFLAGSHRETLWEKAYMLVGMENMMIYLHTEKAFVRELLHRIMDFDLGVAKHYLKAGVEIASLCDDLGTQLGPLLGMPALNEFFVPEYRRLFEFYKGKTGTGKTGSIPAFPNGNSRGRGAREAQGRAAHAAVLVSFHSCGQVHEMLPMFMDLGVDILNPVQASANDLALVRRATAGRMALQGGIGTKAIMDGPPEKIVAEAHRRMWQLGRDGGYFCGPDQGMPFPKAHVDALTRAVEEFGRYPLQPPEGE